jgi:hypothetical protein
VVGFYGSCGSLSPERQIESAIDWGRYAELISYDSVSGVIFLEHSVPAAA